MNQECALVDTGYFIGLTLAGNSQFNLGKSRDGFKLKMSKAHHLKHGIKSSMLINMLKPTLT